MRKVVVAFAIPAALVAAFVGVARFWRRNPRTGTSFVNSVINPWLLRHGLVGKGRSELGEIEHVGRRTGMRRFTPVHPEQTANGFRVLVPLGMQSDWARNVIAAGHCRLHLHDQVVELDEPRMIAAADADDLPWPLRRLMGFLGFQYLQLHTLAANDGEFVEEGPLATEQPVDVAEVGVPA